ncbi:MAG: lipopolysaccharide heptosyltransferase II [Lentisphaeria bacterium]|nr:lipopolysaccharide heptosyltransferase II [Lentisphaeria bacterium]
MADIMIPEIGDIPAFEKIALKESDWRNGVVVRTPNWLGDAVMAIPAMLQLKKIVPDYCGMFVVTPAPLAALFEALPFVDQVVPLKDAHAFMSRSEKKLVHGLNAGIGVLFNNSFRDALSLKFCKIPKLFGANARFRKALLHRTFDFPPRLDFVLNKPHQAAKYLSIVQAMGASPWDGVMPEFSEQVYPETLPESIAAALNTDRPILALAAGAAYGSGKRWHTGSFREVCRRKLGEGCRIVMLGGKSERAAAAEIINGLDEKECFNLAGETGIHELIYVLKHASGCLANDSGVMHLAAAAGTPGVAPFGPTDPVATSPLSDKWRIVFEKRSCSPCFKRVCPYGTKACFDPVTPELVCQALKSVMRKKN